MQFWKKLKLILKEPVYKFQFNCEFSFHQIWYEVPPNHFKSYQFNFKYFVVEKEKTLDFHSNCSWGVLAISPWISRNLICGNFKNVAIPSINKLLQLFDNSLIFNIFEASPRLLRLFSRETRHFNCLWGVLWKYWYTAEKSYFVKSKVCQFLKEASHIRCDFDSKSQ